MIHRSLVAILFVVAAWAGGLGETVAATPLFTGKWELTTCQDLNRTGCQTVCYIFTRTPGTVSGSNSSGTWHDPGPAAFDGKWLQLGDRLLIWGSNPGGLASAAFFRGSLVSSTIINGDSYVAFVLPNGIAITGNWSGKKVGSCV